MKALVVTARPNARVILTQYGQGAKLPFEQGPAGFWTVRAAVL
jgi:hypothetical protein